MRAGFRSAYLYVPSGVYAVMFAVVFTLVYCCCAVESKQDTHHNSVYNCSEEDE